MKFYTLDNQFIEEVEHVPPNFTGIIVLPFGTKYWLAKGRYHRFDGPAAEYSDGSRAWYIDGQYHRLDGPAYKHISGTKEWWVKGNLHRLDGPACDRADGTKEWWVDGKKVTEQQCKLLHFMMKLKSLSDN